MPEASDISLYTGTILVTAAYFILWYSLLAGQVRTKYRLRKEYAERGESFDRYFGNDPQMLAADRATINTQEQMVPFLAALWLHTIFASPFMATLLGAAYVALRAFYPMLIRLRIKDGASKAIALVTVPCYLIIFYLLFATAYTVL